MTPTPRTVARARLAAEAGRQLTPDEVAAYLDAPVSDNEREDARALVAWFRNRYPTGAERLAYIRHANQRWSAGHLPKAASAP